MTSATSPLATGTASGTLLSLLFIMDVNDMVKTAVLASVGAVVSYGVSWLMHKWCDRKKK